MNRNRKSFLVLFTFFTIFLFLMTSCADLPLIGKKKEEKGEKIPEGKIVTVEGMEKIKGVNPPKQESPLRKNLLSHPPFQRERLKPRWPQLQLDLFTALPFPYSNWDLRER